MLRLQLSEEREAVLQDRNSFKTISTISVAFHVDRIVFPTKPKNRFYLSEKEFLDKNCLDQI